MTGEANMQYDRDLLSAVERGVQHPTVRFFRFNQPTVSYGRLQRLTDIAQAIAPGWSVVQRPTGGGVVMHDGDLCVSLCWPTGQRPLPTRVQDQYRWIHTVILKGLPRVAALRLAACADVRKSPEAFNRRSCFENPVGFDLIKNRRKILGGALRCTRQASLYQGSLQMLISAEDERYLQSVLLKELQDL
jgi:lipoyl(octanoyl) transferase